MASLLDIGNLVSQYFQRVNQAKQTPFFNQNNTVPQWLGSVRKDIKKRGWGEGFHDLTYPITTNPYIRPISDMGVSAARMANFNAGRPNPIINWVLGQQNWQMSPQNRNNLKHNVPIINFKDPFGVNQ